MQKRKYLLSQYRDNDPLLTHRFLLEIDGINVGGFTEVTGLSVETEVETIREGGLNSHEHKLPKGIKYTNLSLKRGIGYTTLLWDWYQETVKGNFERKNGTIYIVDEVGDYGLGWNFMEALPVKWDGPALSATANAVAIETLTLIHNGIQKV